MPVWMKKGTMALPLPKEGDLVGGPGGEEGAAWRALHLPLIMVSLQCRSPLVKFDHV